MEPMTVRELLTATGGRLLGEEAVAKRTITGVETDSRAVHEGDLFVALRGERTDGHRYIASALETGAAGCLTEEVPQVLLPGKFYIQVEDTMLAIGQVARAYREKFPIPVIGITGSVGKTTTKDMVASVLGQKFRVLKTEGNFNNELGLPLTLFRLTTQHQICVLEMGMNHFGEIDYLTQIAPPDVAVITNIGDAHIENLGSRGGHFAGEEGNFPPDDAGGDGGSQRGRRHAPPSGGRTLSPGGVLRGGTDRPPMRRRKSDSWGPRGCAAG